MGIAITSQTSSSCTSAEKVVVTGSEFNSLRTLVNQILNGTNDGNDNDGDGIANENEFGLQEIYRKRSKGDMGTQTIAVAEWLSKEPNKELYKQLEKYKLQPKVSDCKLPSTGQKNVCFYIDASYPASPDFYSNMTSLLKGLDAASGSMTYYVYGIDRTTCPYFGHHEGIVTLNWQNSECAR